MTIALLGGTGALGSGLARRLARGGYPIVIGSRSADRAGEAAAALAAQVPAAQVRGATNTEAARAGDLVVLAVPFDEQLTILSSVREALAGKILVDTTVPLRPPKVSTVWLPPEGAAALRAQALLGNGVRVVAAFHNVSAKHLRSDDAIDTDILVTGDDADARAQVVALVRALGLRGLHAGPLKNAAACEALTSVLIWMNRHYKVGGAGLRITGLPDQAE